MFKRFLYGELGDSPLEMKFKEKYPNLMNLINEIKDYFVSIYEQTEDLDLLWLLKKKNKTREQGGKDYLSSFYKE